MKRTNKIEGKTYGEERALYGLRDTLVKNCRIEGEEDGESAFKECKDISLENCFLSLRYPLWHVDGFELEDCVMTDGCRAALWYDNGGKIRASRLGGIKAVRECKGIELEKCKIVSPEFGWQSEDITVKKSEIISEYAFLHTRGLRLEEVDLKGKYTFQYTKDVVIRKSRLDTKDAFWHASGVTVEDSLVKGEYLGWYSDNLTFIRCHIVGTQPLCYCKNLRLIDCTTEGCDLSFEYSDVEASIDGRVDSIKNPKSGTVIVDSVGETLYTDDAVYKPEGKVIVRGRA
ncbi:MAG: DUF3737 family protein [Clostridia bacterium]|nr:DUF3737 family protein [Clostridia bacterium]